MYFQTTKMKTNSSNESDIRETPAICGDHNVTFLQ